MRRRMMHPGLADEGATHEMLAVGETALTPAAVIPAMRSY